MFKKIKNISFLILFLIFIFLVTKHYFSEQNIVLTGKSRSSYNWSLNQNIKDLPILKNDTNNIIVYNSGLEEFKKKRKKRIWETLISNEN